MLPEPRPGARALRVVDTHYGGDVSRIVVGGVGPLPGETVLDKMRFLEREADGIRKLLLYPPHGNPAMCVDLIVEPGHPEARAGYIIMEAMGYPPFSGSNTVCTVTALLEAGIVPMRDGAQEVKLEAPSGLVTAEAECRQGRVVRVTVEGGPAYVAERGRTVDVPGRGSVTFDLVWSGCFYAVLGSDAHGLRITPESVGDLTAFAHAFVEAARPGLELVHPDLGEVGPLSFVHFAGPLERRDDRGLRSSSATYVHPGVLCSCPTGTGTSARLALMAADGVVSAGDQLDTVSPGGSVITGTVLEPTRVGPHEALRSTIAGRAFTLALSDIVIDPKDPLVGDHGLGRILARA